VRVRGRFANNVPNQAHLSEFMPKSISIVNFDTPYEICGIAAGLHVPSELLPNPAGSYFQSREKLIVANLVLGCFNLIHVR